MPFHHPQDNLLVDYAAGSLDEPVGLLVATHLALCPDCRLKVSEYEKLGGALLEEMATTAIDDTLLETTLNSFRSLNFELKGGEIQSQVS